MALNLGKAIMDCLNEQVGQRRTARQIAEWIYAAHEKECLEKLARSETLKTREDLLAQLAAEIGSRRPGLQKQNDSLRTTEERPRRYYLEPFALGEPTARESSSESEHEGARRDRLSEHDLYPLLSQYLWDEFHIYPMRIDERKSSNSNGPGGNRWLYPDVVGMEDLARNWHPEIRKCVVERSDRRSKLWSFEVKKALTRSNARESYFQAVSNCAWASYGYLVAADIEGDGALKELRMLFAAHGVGVIRLDCENPPESQILIPARERPGIDWDMANRLASESKDFLKFVELVRQFYQTERANPRDWNVPRDSI
jgi:uncharacterized protein